MIRFRHVTDLNEAFKCLCRHIEYSTNGGNIKPAVTVFPPRLPNQPDKVRVWNNQLISFAGYKQEDGSVIGDPAYVKITEVGILNNIKLS